MLRSLLIATLLIAGCSNITPAPQDRQAATLEAVPGKSVIYVVRTPMDSREPGTLTLDNREQVTTLRGSAHRWEVNPGTHRIAGVGADSASFTFTTAPGSIYFVEYTVQGTLISGVQSTSIRQVNEQRGRALVQKAQM